MKFPISLLVLVVLIGAALGLGLFATPEPADAGQCFPCGNQSTTTPVVTVNDVDCMWAEKKARMQLTSMAGCANGYCTQDFITTNACHQIGPNDYRVSMKLRFWCRQCIGF